MFKVIQIRDLGTMNPFPMVQQNAPKQKMWNFIQFGLYLVNLNIQFKINFPIHCKILNIY